MTVRLQGKAGSHVENSHPGASSVLDQYQAIVTEHAKNVSECRLNAIACAN